MTHEKECCCNCDLQLILTKHPWNDVHKGNITEPTGLYACLAMHVMSNEPKAVIFEKEHGLCEMHKFKVDKIQK